jgi:hypothetical protein
MYSTSSHFILIFQKLDILTKSLVNEALEWDFKDNGNKPPKDRKSKHLSDLVECIQELGMWRVFRCLGEK